MRNKKRYLIDDYIDDYLEDVEFDDFGNRGLKPMISNGIKKNSLRGQKLNIEVFKMHFSDVEKNTYVWGMDGKIVSAGSMRSAWHVLNDIAETYGPGTPKHIYLHFPRKKPETINSTISGNGRSNILPLISADVKNFKMALEVFGGLKVISIAQETSAS